MYFSDAPWATDELAGLADGVGKFFDQELLPHRETFNAAGAVSREFWAKAAENGVLGISIPEEYGGLGGSLAHEAVVFAEMGLRAETGFGLFVHSIATHYVLAYASDAQKERWLPKLACGELIAGICMTEPGTGSDLKSVKTTAIREGDGFVINGSKTFISNGQVGNFFIVVAKTDPSQGARGISLLGVETDGLHGFRRGQNLKKLGMKAQDTSELFFDDVHIPAQNLIGGDGGNGFGQLMDQLSWERLMVGIMATGMAEAALQQTIIYTTERKAFGKSVFEFQNTRFKLAEIRAQIELCKAYLEKCVGKIVSLEGLPASEASIAKLMCSEMQNRVIDECMQLHGGYGYMDEYPISRMFADARVQRIYGGTSEIMKELIARNLGV